MSRSGRKHNSRWDSKEESSLPFESVQAGIHDKESQPGCLSPEDSGCNGSKSVLAANNMLKSKHELGLPPREPLPGSRGSHRDESQGTKMSPGLDEWRQQNHSHSPKNGWSRSLRSRSRSRSPVRDFKRESGGYDRSRSRSQVSAQLCREFAAGKCRRGNHCQFLHEGKNNFEDRWDSRDRKDGASKYSSPHDMREYPVRNGRSTGLCNNFQKGNCRRGALCNYVHDGASDGFDKVPANEMDREREKERRNIDASYEQGGEREIRRSNDIPCKYFAIGNCRNGKFCRFSHRSKQRVSPDRRSRDDLRVPGRNSDNLKQVWSDTNSAGRNLDDVEQSWDGPKLSDTNIVSEDAKLGEGRNGEMGAPEPGFTSWSMDDRWDHNSDNENIMHTDPTVSHKAVESGEKEVVHWQTENASASIGLSESGGAKKLPGDREMSLSWDYRMQSSNHVVKEEPAYVGRCSQSLTLNDSTSHTHQQDITQEGLGQTPDTAVIMQPTIIENSYFQQNKNLNDDGATLPCDEKTAKSCIENYSGNVMPGHSFNQNGQSSSGLPLSSLNAVGKSQIAFPTDPSRGGNIKDPQSQVLFQEGKSSNKPDIGDENTSQANYGILPSQKTVSSEQLSQLTNLSASLAQLFGNGQQLPQLYATLNSNNATDMPPFSNSEGPVEPVTVALTQPNLVIDPRKQYDPICDSTEPKKPDTSDHAPVFLSNSIEQRQITYGNPQIPSKNFSPSFAGGSNGGDKIGSMNKELTNKSQLLDQPELGANHDGIKEKNEVDTEESKKLQEENKNAQDNDQLKNMDEDGRADEGKKGKDVKGIRAFKFALVEFVKELLKPAWKEGHVSKEAYKTIVKKVVDKVTGSLQGANIPQTQEKIDHYLSFSKPKLTKLVQAYVEKFQKSS